MAKLVVCVYKVRFGDAILVSIPDRGAGGKVTTRHILIDVGNVLGGQGGVNAVFEPVIKDIRRRIGQRPIDLYVMTHEHLDHVQGLLYAEEKLGERLKVDYSWLTGSAEPNYYQTHEEARKKRDLAATALAGVVRLAAASGEALPPAVLAILANNDANSTAKCVDYLRKIGAKKTVYVHRELELAKAHEFEEAKLSVWAPEENTADYYGRLQPMSLGVTSAGPESTRTVVVPPPGVDAGAFYDLVESRAEGYADNLFTIDRAANNTSLVLCVEWRGWRLLFPGDAEQKSWRKMDQLGLLKPVHFLKVGHHGSANGSPSPDLLDKILPRQAPDARPRSAAVSTFPDTYHGVPDTSTIDEIGKRATLKSVADLADGECLEFEFEG